MKSNDYIPRHAGHSAEALARSAQARIDEDYPKAIAACNAVAARNEDATAALIAGLSIANWRAASLLAGVTERTAA